MFSPLQLRTARLLLRPLVEQDGPDVVTGLNDFVVTQWLSVVPWPYSAKDFQDFFPRIKPGYTFAMQDAQGFVGVIDTARHLGYWITPRAQGLGYATEAGHAVLAHHFEQNRGEIGSGYFEGNAASARVLAKLGFVEIARDRLFNRARGQDLPHVSLHLTPAAYAAQANSVA